MSAAASGTATQAPPAAAHGAVAVRLAVGAVPFALIAVALWGFESGMGALVSYHFFAAVVPWIHGRVVRRETWGQIARRLGFRVPDARRIAAWSAGLTAVLMAGISFGMLLGHVADPESERAALRAGLAAMDIREPRFYILLASYNLCVNGLIEETFWRGFFLGWLDELVSPLASAAWNAFLFMLLHVPAICVLFPASQVVPGMLALAIGGSIWVWATRRSGSLWPAAVSHCLGANLTMLVAGWFIVTGA